ncbi:MAG: hypothetical protein HGB12_17260 [Bacteroidetes bacterium]|nr:hypothetical protein [Bacteroidota bacterium]
MKNLSEYQKDYINQVHLPCRAWRSITIKTRNLAFPVVPLSKEEIERNRKLLPEMNTAASACTREFFHRVS